MHHRGVQPASLSHQLCQRGGIGRRIAAQVPAPAPEFGPCTHQALAEILEHLVGYSFPVSFLHRLEEYSRGLFYISVAVAGTDEVDPIPWTVNRLHGQPAIAVVLPIRRGVFFATASKSARFSGFTWTVNTSRYSSCTC